MFHLIQSNKMEALEAQLIELISGESKVAVDSVFNPLSPQTLLVQSPGMAQWLKIEIANHLGIAANLEFPLPSSYIWQLYRRYFSDLPEQSAFTKPSMTWKLMAILPQLLELDDFVQLRNYLQGDDQFKCFLLCQKIADVFDQYQMYRPQWLLDWENGIDETADCILGQHRWQPLLWRKLAVKTQELNESRYHRANLHQSLLEKIAVDGELRNEPPLYIFGLSAIPEQQLEVFNALAKHMDVYVFWCNPSQHYWGDVIDSKQKARMNMLSPPSSGEAENAYFEVGNPLLSSWGKLGRDYQEMLLKIDVQQHDFFIDEAGYNLLTHLQSEMLNLTMRGSEDELAPAELLSNGIDFPKIAIQSDDHSIVIQRCHSKTRELEVLHDYLLDQFANDDNLLPGDIIVMIPDVAQYAPYIDGVFGGAQNELFIPYAISDRSAAQESALIESFIQLVSIHQSRLGLSELLSILEVPAVQQKFEISLSELEIIRFWLQDAGVRWGWDEQDKQRWGLPEVGQNTWLFGLNRLIAGYALDGHDLYHFDDGLIAPYRDIEGQNAQALGKLYRFSLAMIEAMSFCNHCAPIAEKVEGALQLMELFFNVDESHLIYINQLRQCLQELEKHKAQYTEVINQDVFVFELKKGLQQKGVGQRFLAGYVNFCTLMPMRSIPFKRVCILGMNDGDYPRQTVPVGFDLMRQSPAKQGDRSRKQDDRYLFLEAILCAREQLYLSYQGMSSKDNSNRNPSVLISELLDYCKFTYCLDGDLKREPEVTAARLTEHLVTQHPLQPFSARYYDPQHQDVSSYVGHWMEVAKAHNQPDKGQVFLPQTLPEQQEPVKQVEVDELIRAWSNPAKFLFSARWRTNLTLYLQSIEEHEPFKMDALQRFKFVDRAIFAYLQQSQIAKAHFEQVIYNLGAEGALPVGANAQLVGQKIIAMSEQIVADVENYSQGQARRKEEIELSFESARLVGWIDGVYGDNLILHRSGKLRGKDKLQLWIQWLCLCASINISEGKGIFICQDRNYALKAVDTEYALDMLENLLNGFHQMARQRVLSFPETAFCWLSTSDLNKTIKVFTGDSMQSEGAEAHVARMCPDLEAVFDEFCQLSEQIYRPIIDCELKL